MSYLTHLECGYCGSTFDAGTLHTLCPKCGKPLLARYDLESVKKSLNRDDLVGRVPSLWRYGEVLPVQEEGNIISLGEGYTPLIHATRTGVRLGMERLFIKDEGLNPTGSFKARGLCMAISRAKELGVTEVVIPSAGNAAGAMSAYAARAGMKAHVFMPSDVPLPFRMECAAYGADVHLIDGLITDCGREAHAQAEKNGWFDVSTLKEPYRVEGKKTMGCELAEQFNWTLPDVVIYPTGGGTGLIGMWKAFDEMQKLGWIDDKLPRMVSVQAEGCAPIPRALDAGDEFASPWEGAHTVAAGLRVPQAIGDFLILRAIRESNGTAIAVSDDALSTCQHAMATEEGIFACPEGGATLAALEALLARGEISCEETVVLFNTGTGLKYPDLLGDE